MEEYLLFFQLLGNLMLREGIDLTIENAPPEDRAFWDKFARTRETADRQALEDIASCLRDPSVDYTCIEEIIFILESRGLETAPRHYGI